VPTRINADRIRSGLLDDAMIQARATGPGGGAPDLHGRGNLAGARGGRQLDVPQARCPGRLGAHTGAVADGGWGQRGGDVR